MSVDGIFNINKPTGATSFDVVAAVRRIASERRVGHGGTLDPLAVGVLPVCVGQATRVVEYLTGGSKAYCAEIVLGVATDTDDAEGRTIAKVDASCVTREQLEETLAGFLGRIEQVPPKYSAIKVGGRRLYELARAGAQVGVGPRQVEIYVIKLVCYEPPAAVVEVECSKGTYIRSLARDLGKRLGVGGHLNHLVRTRSGPFTIEDAVTLDELAQSFELDYWRSIIYPVDEALRDWPAIIVGPLRERDLINGRLIPVGDWLRTLGKGGQQGAEEASKIPENCRAYGSAGQLIAVLRLDGHAGLWRPQKVFSLGAQEEKNAGNRGTRQIHA